MTTRESARDILQIVPLVMRTVAAELRAAGELPAPAHFGLLSMLTSQSGSVTLTELAALQGVSLPTMSNTISAMVGRGWVRRAALGEDRRVVRIEVTPEGRATVRRVARSAEAHLAEMLAPLNLRGAAAASGWTRHAPQGVLAGAEPGGGTATQAGASWCDVGRR